MTKKNNYQDFLPLVLFSLLLIISYLIIKPFLLIIFLSALLSYVLYPLYNKLTKKFKKKNMSAILICLLVLILIILPSGYMIKILAEESYGVYVFIKDDLLQVVSIGGDFF